VGYSTAKSKAVQPRLFGKILGTAINVVFILLFLLASPTGFEPVLPP
jgi:hypothetical protein